jgi:putative ABC transport system permease protein
MFFFSLVLRNLIRRKMRTLLTVLGISVGVTAVVTLVTISYGFENEWLKAFQARGTDVVVMKSGTADILTSSLDESMKMDLLTIDGVKEVAAVLVDLVAIEDSPGLMIFGWDPSEFLFQHIKIGTVKGVELGRLLTPDDNGKNNVILGRLASDNFKKRVGDDINIETDVFKVVGIYESNSIFENGSLIMPLKRLQEMMDRKGRITVFNIRIESGTNSSVVAREIERRFPGVTAMQAEDALKSNQGIKMAKGMAWATSLIALLVGAIGTLNTMGMSVFERTREIGVLRAVGWKKRRVMVMILIESITMSLIGGVIGCISGKFFLLALSRYALTSTFVSGDIPLSVFGEAFLVAVGLGIVGGAYPAYRGANLSPIEALRYE